MSLRSVLKANNWSVAQKTLKTSGPQSTSISWNLSPWCGHVILAWSADNHFWQLSLTITWMSIIKLNAGCRLSNKQTKWYHFTLVILWCRQMGGPMGVWSHDYQNFLDAWITKFSYPWCSAAHACKSSALNAACF